MRRIAVILGGLLAVAVVVRWTLCDRHPTHASAPARPDPGYAAGVQPIFDRRCVPCHGCFDSPCQLTLRSFDGVDRGATKEIVYRPERPIQAVPTRMFQDAQTTAEWQAKFGFFPVVDRSTPGDLDRSILWRMVEQRAAEPRGGSFDVDATTTCPSNIAELGAELREHPERGMPFGFPPLNQGERDALAAWLRRGAGGTPVGRVESVAAASEIGKWEAFFDASAPRSSLVSAYLFEHLFYAHLHFPSAPGEWFRIVRSRTPSGAPIEEIATRRPTDHPGVRFYYRLRRIRETLVEKTHAPYQLSDKKLKRFRELFYDSAWGDEAPRTHDRSTANPFVAFAAIPARARYQFLLDDALYFVQTFIHGPVCRGQAALDVIDEHFLIFFLRPESDPATTEPGYLARVAADLELPAEKGESLAALSPRFEAKELAYVRAESPYLRSRTLADIWHGDGNNPDAVLTVLRHYDSAFVLRGAVGGVPKTAWVLDFPTFERIYYALVADFDVYGNVTHQISTRLYMNFLRMEGEGQFLRFLPKGERERVLAEWYRGRVARTHVAIHGQSSAGPETAVAYADPSHAKQEFVTRLLTKELPAAVAGPREPIQWPDVSLASDPLRARVESKLRELVLKPGPNVAVVPDSALLLVQGTAGSHLVYTIARNRSHRSVEFILSEGVELEPAEDTLQIISGIATSRPNLFLVVDERDLEVFIASFKQLTPSDDSFGKFIERYGVRRGSSSFWSTFDLLTATFRALDPVGAAVLDLSRYTSG